MSNLMVGIIVCIIGAVFSVIGFLIARTLQGIDKNQTSLAENVKSLWTQHDTLSREFYNMQGQHLVNHGLHVHRRKEDEVS